MCGVARYRKIDPRMWGDEKFKALSKPQPNAQTLWVYLLTGPHTNSCPGLYNLGEMALAESLDWSPKDLQRVFREILDKGMAKADSEARVIYIPNAKEYNRPESPNVVKKWAKDFDEIPECPLKAQFYQDFKAFLKAFGKAFLKPFEEDFGESLTRTIPEPEPKPIPIPKNLLVEGEPLRLSSLLLSKIRERKPDYKEPNLQMWAKSVDLMIRLDKRTPERIEKVILWCQADDFWQNNVLSTATLRRQFDQLELKMRKSGDTGKPAVKEERTLQVPVAKPKMSADDETKAANAAARARELVHELAKGKGLPKGEG